MRRIKKLSLVDRKKALVAKIKRLGWKFLKISRRLTNDFWLRNITLRKTIVLGTGWSKKGLRRQCAILAHELWHVFQRIRMGSAKFLARYAIAEYRWAIEVSAYRVSQFFIPAVPKSLAKFIYKFYRLGRLRKGDVIRETERALA